MKRFLFLSVAVVASMFVSGMISNADAIIISSVQEDLINFPTISLGYQAPTSFSGTVDSPTGSSGGIYRSPWENPNGTQISPEYGTLQYTSVRNGSATYNFGPSDTLNIFWGSPDSYNTLTFWTGLNGTGSSVSLSGGSLGIQTYGHDLVTVLIGGGFFNSVVLSSGQPAFEFANLTTSCRGCGPELATPLPGALPLFASGASLIALLGWRKRRKAQGGAFAAA